MQALGTDNLTLRNEDGTQTIYIKKIPSRKETQDEQTQHRIINCPVVDETQTNLVMRNKDKHNLYNQYRNIGK
jgi:archaellum component FlaG (FlaF/FlaG flagellin family)